MPIDNSKLKQLYATLQKGGYEQDYDTFVKGFTGNDHYANRKQVYDLLSANGAQIGSSYEEFMQKMQAPKPQAQAQRPAAPHAKPQVTTSAAPAQQKPAATAAPAPQKKGWQPTEQQKIQMSYNLGQMRQQVQQGIANTNAKIGRIMMPVTKEGRKKLSAGRFAAQLAGTPTRVVGFAPPQQPSQGKGGGQQQGQKPVESEQSPLPYGVVYENGKPKTQWLLPDGTLTTSLTEANHAEYAARKTRLAHQFQDRMKENGLDPNKPEDVQRQAQLDYEAPLRKALEAEWQRAEAEDRAADEQYRKDYERAKHGGFFDRLKDALLTPTDPNGLPMQSSADYQRDLGRAMQRKQTFNLETLAQAVYQKMPQSYRDSQILHYSDYFRKHPEELKGRSVAQAAKEALQGEVYRATYDRAVQAHMPKSKTEFLMRKIADQPFLSQSMATDMAASALTGSYGMSQAEADAMGRYGQEHRTLDIVGTVANMAFDPVTYISGGVGGAAAKKAMQYTGKAMLKGAGKEVAGRYAGSTMAGRLLGGAAGGVGNFATYNTLTNIEQQMRLGGALDPATGEREFSGSEVLKSTLHGVVLGAVTGALSPVIGNVADKWVKATSNTAGKVGIRAGELATSTIAEGTIFAAPEWVENAQLADDNPNKRSAMDIWTDNLAMMLGFKASHGIKSAPRVIAGMRPVAEPKTMEERNHNRMSFMERLRKQLDSSPRDLDLTQEEREELRKQGYGELADLFRYTPKQKPAKPQSEAKPKMTDGKTMTFDIVKHNGVEEVNAERVTNPEFDGYSAMEALMQDPTVSQSTRAKAYYILTGRQLPMGTVTGYTKDKDEHGNIYVKAVTANGEVVTSRRFADETLAKKEQDKIMRQAELNSVDVGERYTEAKADNKVFEAAVEAVAPGADPETVKRNYQAAKQGDKDAIANYGQMVDAIDKFMEENKGMADTERPEAIRAAIKEETGVDVDEAIKKEPSKRTEPEKAAVQDYIERLFPEQKAENEQPMSDDEAGASAIYDQSRLLWEKVEQGDADAKADVDAIIIRMQEAYKECEDAFGTDAEMRMAEMEDNPWALANDPELTDDQRDAVLYYINAKAAMDGVQDASNDALENKRREVAANVERHTHKDNGIVQPATMKVDDKPVYIVKGNIVPLPDGSGIDVRNSDQSIVICDAETGEYKFASPDQLFSLGEAIDPQTELDEAYANIQAEHEAILGGTENGESVPNLEESVPETPENVQNEGENVQQPMTDEQLHQYARGAFDEATQGKNGVSLPQEQIEQLQQHNQQMLEQEQQRKEDEANRQPTALERVPINEETQEPMFEKADKETALDALNEITGGNEANTTAIVNAQVEQAQKALDALKKKQPTKKAPALKGSPMAMVKAQQEADANYNAAMEQYNAQVVEAEETLSAWSRIYVLMNERKRALREKQEAEWRKRNARLHDEAVAQVEEQKRIAAEKAAEQEAVGTHAVNPKIKAKWDGSTKVEGNPNAITLADGSTIRGHYVLTEAGAATASHDVNNAYEPTEGFPVDENGESVNDRDYKRDKDAQRIVRDMADSYDSRALQTPVIVSKDGVVLSGNNRTMSGEIAAKNGTDKAYVDHLREFGAMFGFTPEQIDGMQHPRVVFVPDEELPYDASTFARFNAEQQKKQSKPEHAVKLGKIVPDNVFTSITNDISRFDRMSDYYADDKSVASAISQLLDAGVINEMQLPELRTGNALSAAGKELIENTLIGKVFQTSPDAVRQIISTPTLRQSVVMGLNEIANNRTLAKSGYDLSKELAAAVDLVSRAKSDSPEIYKEGMPVSPYGRQQGLFDDEYGDSRVTDGVTLLLADLLNSGKPSDLRKVLSTYNNEAASSAAGQIDMFSGDVTSKEEILKNVNEYFRNATPKEQQALIDAAVAERKRRAEAAEPAGGDEASEQATVVAGSDAEPQQPVVASEEPVKGNEPDADALAKEAEEKLSERITDTEDEWTEPSEYGEIYKHRMFVDGKEVIKVDAPDKSKNYPGTYYEIDGKQFGDLYEVANYIDGNEQPLSAKIEAASAEVNTDPTEAQKEAGNYKKGHVQVGTFDITIEQPQGSVRKGTDADGKQWESKMNNTYGYIRGAVGVDGDHIDVFLSNDIDGWNGRKVFVVDQYDPDGSFDEHKVMLGFNDQDEAKGDYLANYEQGWENGRRIDITGVNLEDFEKWIESSKRKTKPFGEYSSVKKDVVEINAPEEAGYSITPSTYTNKKGKTSDVSLLTFDHDLTADQERAVKEFAKERTGEGRFAPARGWKDRESGGWMFRSEEDARKAAEMVGNEQAVADNQPMTAQELRDAVEPKKPTASKKTAAKKPTNRVESVPTEEPIEPEKSKYKVSDEEMNGLMNDIRDILGIGDDEGDAGFKFRDPDELTAEQRQKLMSVGQRLAMAMVERGNESFGNYASMMVKALGDKVRPWLKAFYGGLEYVPGYDKYALTPYEEVKAFDVENFDKPTKDVMAQANMIVEEGKAQVAAEKANNELKATRNEQRKETEKQTAANTDAVAAEAKSVASEATALAETSSDEQALTGAAERVDETLDKVNEQLALLGYYEADEVEKDYNEAYGYMRNAEKKVVKDAANLASQLISDLNLNHYEASHSKQTDKKGNRKKKPLAVSNISPIGGDVSIHLPLEEGRELYLTIGVEPRAAKGVDGFGGSDLEVTHIMFRVDHPEGTGNDRYGRNVFVDSNVTYSDLLKQVQREAYKYLIGSGVTNEGEYAAGDKVQYSTDGGRTWTDAVVVQPNDEGGIRIDTGLAPVMWVNAHPDQLRHKPSESAEPKHEADGDFYEDGINEDAVAALPEDTAIQLHVVDILNPGMTDHSMKSKIESLNTLLPKISDKKLSELDKEYGDDKDMGTHIKAEVARRAKDGGVQPTSSEEPADKPKPASKKNATKKVKPEQPVGDLFAGLFDNTLDNGLQGNDEAVRTETMPADNSGQQQGLRESQGSPRKTAAQEGGRPDGGRGGQSTGKDRAVSAGLHGLTQPKNTRNNHSERGADHAPTSVNGRIEANIKAIELAHELLESGETATPEQMSVLRQFSGWGGLGAAFSDGGYDWKQRERNKKIRELLGEEAYEQAVMSANSAYYTPAYVVDTLWDIANQLGFKGGNILEGSAGIGNILGQMPTMVSERSNIHAIEIDGTSGGILSLLYPDAKVQIQGFEQTRIPNGSVDLAITNVPFVTGLRVNDITGDSDLSKKFHNIHDFCIAKNVRKLREGGLGIFISSNGTLDNSKALRDWVVNEGGSDFIGAFRMNNKTFGGTTVTSDIIVIRKRVNGQKSAQAIDVSSISGERTAEYEEPGARKAKQLSMDYNKYFIEHPDHMAGEMRFAFEEGDTFRPTSKGLYPVSGKDQGKMLVDFVKSFTEEDSSKATTTDHHDVSLVLDASADGKKLGEMYMKAGQIVLASFGGYYPLEVNDKKIKGHTKQECFTAYAAIKSALADVMQYQTVNESDAGLKPLIAKLNKAYDAFVNTYGHFNKNNQLAWLRNDVDYPNVFSLETYKEQGDGKGGVVKTYDKADVMKGRVVEKESEPHPENVKDGVVVSMFKNGRIDVPYIASQLGKSEAEVKREIIDSGLGFEDPTTRQMEVSYQYLSGNVREKLKQADANNENGEYSKNIKALQDVVPMNIPAHLIDFTLGSSWLDPKLYDEYVKERTDIDVHFTAAGGTWFMKAPTYGVNVEKNRAMGIVSEMLKKTIMGHELISAAIQNKSIIVSRTEKHYDGTTETITDREATAACAAKIDEIRQDFKDWARGKMQSDADLSARMEQEYNDRFNNYVPMSIPDDFVPEYFGGATHKFKMRSHQGKAIVRGTMQPLLLAHEVGTGKTFTLISTAMEMRRLGTARKPMIVVQNATVGQFAASAKELYPNAKILTLEDNDRNAEGRKNFYAKIKYNDWDMIVVPQSTFEFIPDSDERQMQFVQDKIDEKMLVLEQMREADSSGRDPITRRAEKELADLQAEMAALSEGISKKRTANNEKKKAVAKQNAAVKAQEMLDRRTDDVENFDDMGIDALLIDEAHEYKHLGFATAMQRGVKGVDPSYSKKSQGVYLKTQAVLEKNNGRNVIFATGTPISNTAAEIWTFMRYLMPKDTMKEYGIYYFDDFVRNFGNLQQMMEFKTNGKFQEVNRFAGYVNLPELVRIWSGVADTALTKDQTELVKKTPEMEGGKAQDIYLPQTRALRSVMKYVREELERFDQMSGKEKKENSSIPLTMYGIAQGAAVDARLVEMHAEDDPRSKTNEAVRQTLRSLKETDDYKGTVAIFADHYQNKRSGFNLYEDIKKKLIQQGVPASEIVVMKSGMKIKQKLEIFDKVNRGEVRVILGSTATLGTGVNIQERLHTLIHLDAPNRPMDYTQRNGRILRQGNLHKEWNKPVRVLRFGVEDSLDVTAYQRLKTKGAIADSVMESDRLMQDSMNSRVLEEEEDVFGDTVAQLSGSEYALLKNNAEKNVRKYESRRKQWEADQTYIHNVKPKLEGQIKAAAQRAEEANAHLLAVQKAFPDGKFTEITVGKLKFASVDAMTDFIKDHNRKILDAVKAMKENPGNKAQTHTLTLSLGGYDFVVKTEMSRETVNNGGLLFAEIHRKMSYSCPELGLNDVPVKQSLLRNAVEDITENVITGKDFAERFDIATRMVQHGKSELEQLKQREGKPFEFSKELEEAKRQFEEYSEAMKVEMAEKEKKYAEMDASVEAASDVVIDDEGEDSSKHRMLDDDAQDVVEPDSMRENLSNAMVDRVTELSERLHTSVRIIRTEEEVVALPSARQRRMKGSFNPLTGEVTIVVPNNANMADIENTFVHEVVGHDGLRVLFPDEAKLNNALDELYRVSKDEIRGTIDRMAQKMYDAEVDRLREKKRKEHEANGEDSNASYYADMAEAHAEASKKREQFKRDATEEYGADLAGRIGEKGFEKMSAEELTFWGKLKAMLQKALQKLLDGLKIPGKRKWGDKDWAFVLHEAYKRKKNGGKPTVFDAADTEVMRRKTGYDEGIMYNDGNKKKAQEPKPIGHGFFGNVYNQFKGKVMQAVKFLTKHGSGDLLGVFHRNDVGDIDMVWGDEGGGLCHILNKHINDKDFPTVKELVSRIEDIVNNGAVDFSNGDKIVLKKDGYVVTIRRNIRDKGIKIADKNWVLTAYNKDAPANTKAPADGTYGSTAVAPGTSSDAKVATLSEINEIPDENVAENEGLLFRDGDMGLEETITKMKVEASQANADNWQAKQDAMRAIGGNLNKLRQAMARQRAYDLWTVKSVTDLAQILLDNGLLDDMSKHEYNRILSAVKNVHGKKDISKYVDKVMDVMVGNQLRAGETRLGRLERIRASKVDAKGIDVQGQLDADGQAIMKAFRSAKPLSVEELDKKILEATDRMSNTNEQIAANAALEHTGLLLAKQYVDGVSESKKAVAQFKDEVKKAEEEMNAGQMTEEAFKQFKDAIDETIKQLKIDRIEAYNNLTDSLGGVLDESVERAKQWKEAEKERVNKIHHLANSDMQGRELKGHRPDTKVQWLANSWVARFAFEPLSTFDQMLKMFGSKNPNGEGYMQDYFMRHWIDSTDNEQLLKERYQKQMDDKVAEIFGKKYKYLDLYGYVQTQKSATVKYYDGADMREYEIAQDGLLYLYAVEKMPMGKATNRRMGITDETMEKITDALDPKLKEFADWVQEDFLPSIGMESDVVYTRMFGTHMDSIENYFPFVRDKDALKRDVENGQSNSDNDRISVQTGAIKKRVASVALWNLKDMSFLDVLAKHVGEMSHWQSFAELNRDIGTLLSYNRFKQQVMNMSSVYGSGKELWKRFEQCAAIATDCYEPQRAKFDRLMVQGAKGVTMGKIAFRPFTALKQTLSLPAFFGEVNAVDMAEALATCGIPALKWSWNNMPNFRKRILSRTTGDYRLRETEYDSKIMKAASYGMLPNIGVDAWTIAVGSHCVYKAQKRKYLRWGMEEERAERRAVQDAEMCFNKSQQSSEGAYMAPIQIDHTFYATSAMLFRNSSTAYTRETHNSARNLKRIFSGEVSEDYVAKQILRTIHPNAEDYWSDAEWAKARAEAKREIRSAKVKNGVNLVMFGWILPWLWRIGGTSVLLALTGDNEERAKQLIDATKQSVFAPMEGLTYGDVFEGGINKVLGYTEQSWSQQGRENPMISDMKQMLNKLDYDWVQATNDVLNILGGMTTGVNPQTFTDWAVAIMDFCGDDAKASRECALLAARLLNCPQSQLDKVYLEELDMTAAEAKGMTPAEVAERYARYKMMREAPLTGWMRSAEKSDSISAKKQNKVFTIAKEKLNSRMETEETKQLLSDYDAVAKQKTALSKIKKTDRAAYREGMKQLRQSNDMRQHMRLKRYKHDMNELTSKYLRCKSAEERDSIVSTMFSTRAKMLDDIGRMKQQ